jgi:hypothetical protein
MGSSTATPTPAPTLTSFRSGDVMARREYPALPVRPDPWARSARPPRSRRGCATPRSVASVQRVGCAGGCRWRSTRRPRGGRRRTRSRHPRRGCARVFPEELPVGVCAPWRGSSPPLIRRPRAASDPTVAVASPWNLIHDEGRVVSIECVTRRRGRLEYIAGRNAPADERSPSCLASSHDVPCSSPLPASRRSRPAHRSSVGLATPLALPARRRARATDRRGPPRSRVASR